jgi:calcium/calmodulin-dependent 3',5'-cyclic nucleotide phosphodiesterase
MLFAAAVHDFEHTGTTNNFHVQTRSRLAMIYNDRSVLENHHLSVAFRLLQNPDIDILMGLAPDEFKVKKFSNDNILSYGTIHSQGTDV